jgi:hypothetical protein
MSGEILRAVLEDSCLWSRPAWYGDHQLAIAPAKVNGRVRFTMSGLIKTRANTFFLCTSINANVLDLTFPVATGDNQPCFIPRNALFPLTLRRSATHQALNFNSTGQNAPPISAVTTYPVSSTALPTYLYFRPEESLEWEILFDVAQATLPITPSSGQLPLPGDHVQADILLQGIEYMMPTGAISGQAA